MSFISIICCYVFAVIATIAEGRLFYYHIGDDASLTWTLDPIPAEGKSVNTIHPSGTNLFIARGTVFQESEAFSGRVDFTGNTTAGIMNFTLINVTENDAGVYTVNYDNVDYMETTLVIYVKPSTPTIVTGTPVQGSDLGLVCSAQSTSIPANNSLTMTYRWYINGTRVPDETRYVQRNQTLTIKNIQKSDNGTSVTCTAEETLTLRSTMSLEYIIMPEYGPDTVSIVSATGSNYSMVNSSLGTVTCSADCYPECTFMWRHNGAVVTFTKELMIESIQKEDAGKYNCTATNKYGSMVSIDFLVVVLAKPSTPLITSGAAVVGHNVKLKCSSTSQSVPSSNLEMSYTWYIDGEILPNEGRYNQEVSYLEIKNIQKSDKGLRITCQANEVPALPSDVSAALIVDPQYPPSEVKFNPTQTNYTLIAGATLGPITCTAVCYPECSFSWVLGNTYITQTSLTIANIQMEQSGIYACNASNSHGNQVSDDINVEVKPLPGNISLSLSGPVDVVEGEPLPVIKCRAICFPECTYMWTHLDDSETTKGSILNLGAATRKMSGTYICTASNQYSSIASGNFVINVLYGPGVSITFHPNIDNYEVSENTSMSPIKCSADCNPVCTFIWEKIEGARYSNPINLGNVSRQTYGQYICRVSNVVDSSNKLLTVSVMGKDNRTSQGKDENKIANDGPNTASVIVFSAAGLILVTCIVCGIFTCLRVSHSQRKPIKTRNVNSHASTISHYADIDKGQGIALTHHSSEYGKLLEMDDTTIYETLQSVVEQALPVDTPVVVVGNGEDNVTLVDTDARKSVNTNTLKTSDATKSAGNALHTADLSPVDGAQVNGDRDETYDDYLKPVTKTYIESSYL